MLVEYTVLETGLNERVEYLIIVSIHQQLGIKSASVRLREFEELRDKGISKVFCCWHTSYFVTTNMSNAHDLQKKLFSHAALSKLYDVIVS